jgi:excisionase family DNA binding protein
MRSTTIGTDGALETLLAGLAAVPRLEAKVAALEAEVVALRALAHRAKVRVIWLTQGEAAEILRCSAKTVGRMIQAGKLRRDLESWRVRILAEDVEAYAAKVTVPLF